MRLNVAAGKYPLPEDEISRIEDSLNLAVERGKKYIPLGDGSSFVDDDFDDITASELNQEIRSKRWNGETMVNVEDFEDLAKT